MRLIDGPRAPNPRRVRIFLAEKGVTLPKSPVDLALREHQTPAFTQVNPMQEVPVLVLDDGTVIAESIAICRYLEDLHPEPNLFGATPLERAQIEMWNRRMEFKLFFPVAQAFRHGHPHMAELEVPQVKAWGEANVGRTLQVLGWLDGELKQRPFIAGARFTVADITALVAVDWMKVARIKRPPELVNLNRWYEAITARPSAAA